MFISLDSAPTTTLTGTVQATRDVVDGSGLVGGRSHNPGSSTTWLLVFNAAAADVTLGTTTPVYSIGVPPGSSVKLDPPRPIRCSAGMSMAAAGAADGSVSASGRLTVTVEAMGGSASLGADTTPAESVSVTMPPMSLETSEESMRDMGRLGAHSAGRFWTLGTNYYVWYDHNGYGWDPGAAALEGRSGGALEGRTGIEVALGSGNQSGTAVATATASAITAVAGLSASSSADQVDVTGASTAADGARGYSAALTANGMGMLGMRQTGQLTYSPFGSDVIRAARFDPAALPSETFVATGCRVRVGPTHTSQLVVALAQGGSSTSFLGATILGDLGVTTGSDTDALLHLTASTPIVVDPAAGELWIVWMHDAGSGFQTSYGDITSADGTDSDYIATSANGTWVVDGGVSSSDPADLPATLGTPTSGTVVFPPIAIAFCEATAYDTSMTAAFRMGTRAASGDMNQQPAIGPSGATLMVGNSFTNPDVLGASMRSQDVAYGTHATDSHYRCQYAEGGLAQNDWSGSTIQDVGQATGTDTGWVTVTPTAGAITMTANARSWLLLRFDGSGSTLLYQDDLQAPDGFNDEGRSPAAHWNGFTSESEYDDGTNGGTATTNIPGGFDPTVALSGVVSPNGTNYNFDNGVGTRAIWEVLGFAVLP